MVDLPEMLLALRIAENLFTYAFEEWFLIDLCSINWPSHMGTRVRAPLFRIVGFAQNCGEGLGLGSTIDQ